MEDNIMMISESMFKKMLVDAAYEGAKKALTEVTTCNKSQKKWLSLNDAVAFLDAEGVTMSAGHLKNLTYRNEIPVYKINRRLSFAPQDLKLWIERNAHSNRQSLENAACELVNSVRRKGRHSKIA